MMRKAELKLNSYKIDTNTLQNSIKQLNEMREQLQTTVSYYKSNEDKLIVENERLKQQISILQNKTIEKLDHSICINKILQMENKFKQQKLLYEKIKQILEKQQYNHKIIIQEYQNKLQKSIVDNQNSINKYQQKINILNKQIKQSKIGSNVKSKKSKNSQQIKPLQSKKSIQQKSNQQLKQTNQFISVNNEKNDKIKDKNFNYTSNLSKQKINHQTNQENQIQKQIQFKKPQKQQQLKTQNIQYNPSNEIYQNDLSKDNQPQNFCYFRTTSDLPNDEDQQIFLALIRKLLSEIKSFGISVKQTLVLPQLKKMINNKHPSYKDLFNFMKNPPISEKSDKKIQQSLAYIQSTLLSKYGEVSGKLMVEMIIRKLEQYEQLSKINTQDLQISQMTPSERSTKQKERHERKDEKSKFNNYKDLNRTSIQDYLNIQSTQYVQKQN